MLRLLFVTLIAATGPLSALAADEPRAERLSTLDNGVIRIGVNLDLGGAITWLSKSGSDVNVVNSWDYGRQIQMSYYSGPTPFSVGAKQPKPQWAGLGWNPIQTGDDFHHASKVLEHRNDGRELYVKCTPMIWPLDDVPAECTFECWITLDGPAAKVRSRLVNRRTDRTQYTARRQELPAVYVNGPLYRLYSYTGDKPFSGGELTRIEKPVGSPGPWTAWRATENWSAAVRDDGFGLGVWHSGCTEFSGGFAGQPGAGGPHDDPTAYLCPGYDELLDHNIEHQYSYVLILGQLDDIRRYVVDHARRPAAPHYVFEQDRQHWHYEHARDAGWPIRGELQVELDQNDPQLVGPGDFWPAAEAPKIAITAAYHTSRKTAELYYRTFAADSFSADRRVEFPIISDDAYHTYEIDLSAQAGYTGAITGLRFDPTPGGRRGEFVRVKSIVGHK